MDYGKVGCHHCGKRQRIMKRCVRCQAYFYCSSECQKQDWKNHKVYCNRVTATPTQQKNRTGAAEDAAPQTNGADSCKDIWDKDTVGAEGRKPFTITWGAAADSSTKTKYSSSFIDFEKAAKDLKSKDPNSATMHPENIKTDTNCTETPRKGYLHNNTMLYDVPDLNHDREVMRIVLKANRVKYNVDINAHWTGSEILKVFAFTAQIPLDKMTVIHRGKRVNETNVRGCVSGKAVFLALGEQAEDETGLDKDDIHVMMQQMNIERNEAVKALRSEGELLDAIVKVANK